MSDKAQSVSSEYVPNGSETYEEWFDRQVGIGLLEADDPDTRWIDNKEVFRQIDERLDDLDHRSNIRKAS